MKYKPTDFQVKELQYIIRMAIKEDAEQLSQLRLQIDGETEQMDRERGEDYLDAEAFEKIIEIDLAAPISLFLVAEKEGRLIAYSRLAGNHLKRFSHKAEFGLGVLKEFWGFGIGKNLMSESISWADQNDIKKIELYGVLETNTRGIELYKKLGFEIEGISKKDRVLSDGNYYSTYIMARFYDC